MNKTFILSWIDTGRRDIQSIWEGSALSLEWERISAVLDECGFLTDVHFHWSPQFLRKVETVEFERFPQSLPDPVHPGGQLLLLARRQPLLFLRLCHHIVLVQRQVKLVLLQINVPLRCTTMVSPCTPCSSPPFSSFSCLVSTSCWNSSFPLTKLPRSAGSSER